MRDSVLVCPCCGMRATYVGFMSVECATAGCANYVRIPSVAKLPVARPDSDYALLEMFDPNLFEGFPFE